MAQAFFGGVHPNDMKAATNEKAIEQLQAPAQVVIPMSMHFGAPCTPTVSKGDYVKLGQKIGEFKGLGAPIHASVSGTVAAVEPRPYSMGGKVMSVVIDNDFKDDLSEEVHAPADPDALSVEEMVEMVKQAGIVGMGGATFPTHTKISSGIGKVDTVIINGAECEPYITGDHRAMLERPAEIIGGCCYLAKMFGVSKVVIGVEDNKKNGIESLNKVIEEQKAPVVVESLRCRYPQGGEKQLCQAITGKQVPPGGLPANIGCAVFNINTTIAIYHAIKDGMPVVRKVVTVSGSGYGYHSSERDYDIRGVGDQFADFLVHSRAEPLGYQYAGSHGKPYAQRAEKVGEASCRAHRRKLVRAEVLPDDDGIHDVV